MSQKIIFNRIWAMPNKETFKIKPIAELLQRYVKAEQIWIDPFAGGNSPATITNDLNPKFDTNYNLDAVDFLHLVDTQFEKTKAIVYGVILDPPYSPRQVRECYESIGLKTTQKDTQLNFWFKAKQFIGEKICPELVIKFGWDSNALGKKFGYEVIEILLVPHGARHYDTIVTVERKSKS